MTKILGRLRWGLTCAIAAGALVAAKQSFVSYQSHGLGLGLGAVVALVFVLFIGLVSLALARLRAGRELTGLQATPAVGDLFIERRKRLEALRAAGARPDLDALADATAAVEAGRAYLGRYFVATTVLIGLVGTFAGLMETMGQVAPLLSAKDTGSLALMAGPLSGLHVTFGASLVAILVTLALALAQGDLALAETQMLALLEDRTRHELIPALWPASEEPAERTVRALADLEKVLAAAITKSMQGVAAAVGKTAGAEVDRLSALVDRMLTGAASALADSSEKQVKAHQGALAALSTTLHETLAGSMATTQSDLSLARASVEKVADELRSVSSQMGTVSRTHADALRSTSGQLMESLDRGVLQSGAALDRAATDLAKAATTFATTAEILSPTLTALGTEVGAVAREVALLAASSDDSAMSATLLAELDRVGAGVEDLRRLAALAKIPMSPPADPEPSVIAAPEDAAS